MRDADEYDAFGKRSRRLLCYLQRPGVIKWIKRKYNKRVRAAAKAELRKVQS